MNLYRVRLFHSKRTARVLNDEVEIFATTPEQAGMIFSLVHVGLSLKGRGYMIQQVDPESVREDDRTHLEHALERNLPGVAHYDAGKGYRIVPSGSALSELETLLK